MDRNLLRLLALASMFSAGNVYYAQPLLADIARDFGVSSVAASMIPVLTQAGYVAGLLFITPLGDVFDRRRLLLGLLFVEVLTLAATALSRNFFMLEVAAFAVGASSILVQIIFPLVASLSAPAERARNLGLAVSSALVGILLSRAVSGAVGGTFGWRWVYVGGAACLSSMGLVLWRRLPAQVSGPAIPYLRLLASLGTLFRDLPALRTISVNGALLYASLSAFWASLIFYLESPAHGLGPQAAGAFGFLGALGAVAASRVGGFIDRYGPKRVILGCMALMAFSFAVMGLGGGHYSALILGVVLLDVGAQGATVTNQNELYSIHASAHARLNTIYKIIYFIGGAAGSALSAVAWSVGGWLAVSGVGGGFVLAALLWEQLTAQPRVTGRAAAR